MRGSSLAVDELPLQYRIKERERGDAAFDDWPCHKGGSGQRVNC